MGDAQAGVTIVFDYEAALTAARKLLSLSNTIEAKHSSRQTDYETAQAKWEGRYSTQFATRREGERTKETNLIDALRSEADAWAQAWAQAKTQQAKNDRAAEVEELAQRKRDDRAWYESASDTIGFTEDSSWEDANNEVPAATTYSTPTAASNYAPTD